MAWNNIGGRKECSRCRLNQYWIGRTEMTIKICAPQNLKGKGTEKYK